MNASVVGSRTLIAVGLAGMLVGAVDPLEGAFAILPSLGLATLGAFIGRSRYQALLCCSFALVAYGVVAMVVLSSLGGIGGDTGRSVWWALLIVPYPLGWTAGLSGAVLALVDSCKKHGLQRQPTR